MSLTAPTITGYSPFWSNVLSPNQPQGGTYAFLTGQERYNSAYVVAKLFKKRAMADARGALAALIGAAAGGTATVQYKRMLNPASTRAAVPTPTGVGEMGGNITFETVDSINRATTAADITELKKWFSPTALLAAQGQYGTVTGNNVSAGLQIGGTGRF